MPNPVTDPDILKQLNGSNRGAVTDPAILDQLNGNMSAKETAIDVAKSAGVGLGKGAIGLAGFFGDASDAGAQGIQAATDYVTGKLGIEPTHPSQERRATSVLNYLPTSEGLQKKVESVTGPFYEPKTGLGHAAETVSSFVPGAVATGGGNMAASLMRYAALPGLATEAAGKALEGSQYKPYGQAAAGIGASLINPARAVTPFPIDARRAASLATLENEGVTSLTAGQRTGNTGLRYLEDAASSAPMAGHGAARIENAGQQQFTEAAARRAGPITDASPESLGPNQRRLGNEFERLSNTNNLTPDNQFINDLTDAARNYRNVPPSQQRAMIQGYFDDIIPHVNNGTMPGPAYQEMRSRLSRQADSLRQSDPTLAEGLRDTRNALDNAMRRSISPADAEAWDTARREYAAQKTLEKVGSRAGELAAEGQITPASLRNTVSADNRGAYARGEGQFADLARAGAHVMTPLPNSGTAQRMNAFHVLNATLGGIPQALAGRALMSQPVQNYLANQLIQGGAIPTNPAAREILAAQIIQRLQQPSNQTP